MKRRTVILGLLTAGLALALLWPESEVAVPPRPADAPWQGSASSVTDRRMAEGHRPRPDAPRRADDRPALDDDNPLHLPPSLIGTDIDGGLLTDAHGGFRPTTDAIDLFDYFLTASGELPLEEILARIRDEIRARLESPAREQAMDFLELYMEYRRRGAGLGAPATDDGDLRGRFEAIRDLRRAMFGDELAGELFGMEEAQAEVMLRARDIAEDPDLDEAAKKAAIEEALEDLPAPLREAREAALAAQRLRQDEARLRDEGADDAAIRALREERFGVEAADRLDELDRQRARWQSRVDLYRTQRDAIAADPSVTAAAREQAIADLLERSFQPEERLRVQALDRLAAQGEH